jgi:hypothetical protein
MNIIKLNESHVDVIRPLFNNKNYMGQNISTTNFFYKEKIAEIYHKAFYTTYLTGLSNYHAFGMMDENNNVVALISCYQSSDEPSWYGTNIRSSAQDAEIVRQLLDKMIQFNEEQGRLKFYTLWAAKHARLLRRFAFSAETNERYDYFDEMTIPAQTRCLYNNYWQILFNRVLLPHDTVVRCSFLKQKYRNKLHVGGSI